LTELRRFFDRALRSTFTDLALHDGPAAEYLADLLTRFARTDALYAAGAALPRLETVVDMLTEAQAAWQEASFHPEREVTVRRHIGDYTLFMSGIFPERVAQTAGTGYFIAQGRRAYRFVAEHDRASAGPTRRGGAPLYGRLAERFEAWVGALDYARKVHFRDHPAHPLFRFGRG
jgi:hypothetical protein